MGGNPLDGALLGAGEQVDQLDEPRPVGHGPQVGEPHLQQIEDMERVAHGLAVQKEVVRQGGRCCPDGFWEPAFDAPAVDAGQLEPLLVQEEAFAVVLALDVEPLISKQGLGVLDGIEELGTDDHVSAVTRLDGDPVNLVRALIAVMKCCVHDVFFLLLK